MNNQDWLEVLTAHFVHITLAVVLIRFLQEPTCRMIFDREYTQGCQKWHWSRSQAFHTLPEVQVIKLQIASQSYKDPEELDVMWSKCVFVSTLHARWGKIPLEAWRSFILGMFFCWIGHCIQALTSFDIWCQSGGVKYTIPQSNCFPVFGGLEINYVTVRKY